jgi:hypothetical protein
VRVESHKTILNHALSRKAISSSRPKTLLPPEVANEA